jgi:hypothetical protein
MLLTGLVIIATGAQPVQPADESRPPAVRVRLATTAPVFAAPSEVRIQVAVENVGSECYPVLIDPVFQPIEVNRPSMLLQLLVYDEAQRLVPIGKGIGSDLRGLKASDLLVLNCSAFYGRYLDLSRPDWPYNLVKGTYRVRARVTSHVGTFVKRKPDLLAAVEKMVGLSSNSVAHMLADWMAESNEVVFEVR